MMLDKIYNVNYKVTRGGLVNSYKIILYKENNINKDYEMSSFNTRIFS